MNLTKQEVEHVASLARLSLTEAEVEQYREELSRIFEFIEQLQEVNVSAVTETSQVTGLEDALREDTIIESSEETKKKLIDAFPKKLGKLLQVKGVFIDRVDDSFL